MQGIEEKRNLPLGGEFRAGGCICALGPQYVQNTPSRWPLSSPPEGRLRFSSTCCTPRGPWEFTGLSHFGQNSHFVSVAHSSAQNGPKRAQNGRKVLKIGVPPVLTSFSVAVADFRKKVGNFRRWTSAGGKNRTFFQISATTWSKWLVPYGKTGQNWGYPFLSFLAILGKSGPNW